ncbi:hypothetical protein Acr_14g0003360 [Actinidia rufa]|uniref:Uncharacterized protein n=1 Tax=Actinidia rufa TaxID=165716 RepID=A0A7J0FPY0_9ERIC|nr:hypothetical protein Acr_14g0003360 [Actinidia rufa]
MSSKQAFFTEWKGAEESERKKVFIEFMKKKVKLSKFDNAIMVTGLVTLSEAMAAKRAGESFPQLRIIKAIPDVLATVLALVSVKLSRRIFVRNVASPS